MLAQKAGDLGQLVLAADERRRQRREIAAAPAVDRDGRDRRVVREDRLLEAPQLEPRLEPQLVAEHAPSLLERLERVRLAAAAIERQHQLPPQALPEGVVRERRAKRRRELPMLSERQRNLELLLERVHAQRFESARLVAEPRRTGQTLQRRSAPEGQRRPDRVRRATNVAVAQRAARRREQLLEAHRVHAGVAHGVPIGRADDRALAQRRAKAGDVMMQRVARSGRKLLPPQSLDERVDVDHPALAERKHRQQRLTLRAADLRERPARDNLERAEKPDFQWRAHSRRRVACTDESRRLDHAGEGGRL